MIAVKLPHSEEIFEALTSSIKSIESVEDELLALSDITLCVSPRKEGPAVTLLHSELSDGDIQGHEVDVYVEDLFDSWFSEIADDDPYQILNIVEAAAVLQRLADKCKKLRDTTLQSFSDDQRTEFVQLRDSSPITGVL